eukprot:c26461_g1_i1 orf=987-1469(+)
MHMMRRLKSFASGRPSVSDPIGDAGTKRAKLEQGNAEVEGWPFESDLGGIDASRVSEKVMASASLEPAVATTIGHSSMMDIPFGGNFVDWLPNEMHEMKIKDDNTDQNNEQEPEATVIDGSGTETGHLIVTTIAGLNGQSKQTVSYAAERIAGTGSFGIV